MWKLTKSRGLSASYFKMVKIDGAWRIVDRGLGQDETFLGFTGTKRQVRDRMLDMVRHWMGPNDRYFAVIDGGLS